MDQYSFYSTLKISIFKVFLLVLNSVILAIYISNQVFDWILYLILLLITSEVIHLIDVFFKLSYIKLEGDTLTIRKWLSYNRTYNLNEYQEFKGRQRNGRISSLVTYHNSNPKLYIFIMNVYKDSLNKLYMAMNPDALQKEEQ